MQDCKKREKEKEKEKELEMGLGTHFKRLVRKQPSGCSVQTSFNFRAIVTFLQIFGHPR